MSNQERANSDGFEPIQDTIDHALNRHNGYQNVETHYYINDKIAEDYVAGILMTHHEVEKTSVTIRYSEADRRAATDIIVELNNGEIYCVQVKPSLGDIDEFVDIGYKRGKISPDETLLENLAKRRLILINANMSEDSEPENREEIIDNFDWQLRRIRKFLNL